MSSKTPQGPRSTEHGTGKHESGFDPAGPGVAPHKPRPDPEAKENAYSPDFKSRPEPKPHHDADIDTPSG